jgi:RHS repeat-associated protein
MDVAPPLEDGVVTEMLEATEFLYTGPNPIQTGVTPGTIVAERAAVLRGVVTDRSNALLSGVRISILGHPELGQTLTRDDGMFDMAVNGGGYLTVHYEKDGFLSAQRQANVPWEDYVVLPDVVLVGLDPVMTSVDLTAAVPIQVARGSQVSDTSGTRQATVLVPQGTTATMVFPNGTTQPINQLSIRATEYTVGSNGPSAMPAELPPTSGYTYAVELSIDEAIAAGASGVQFGAPLPFYVENFLGFPIGATVPFGMYDRQRGVWDAQPSGRVIKILSFSGGLANVDVDGNGVADTGAALTALSITDAERQQLASLYAAGQSVWRVLVPHFSPADLNWTLVPPPDAIAPDQDPELDDLLDNSCEVAGSIIECQNQILGEEIPIAGTNLGLHYRSDRVPGYTSSYTIEIPLTPNNVPPSLQSVQYNVQVAGRSFLSAPFAPTPNRRTTFTWDGEDVYGRRVSGAQRALVQVLYNYQAVYGSTGSFGASAVGGAYAIASRTRAVVFRSWVTQLGTWHAESVGLGGWTLTAHHAYDPIAQVLYRGDGHRENARSLGPSITTAAGTGTQCASVGGTPCGDGGQATAAQLRSPGGLAVGPDGNVYIATGNVIRRVARDGVISTVAGTGVACTVPPCGDGGPATQAQLGTPVAVAVGPDNSLYIADRGSSQRVRRVGPDGIIRAFAGDGTFGSGGDGGPALLAQLNGASGIAIGPDGSVYVSQGAVMNPRVRRIGPDGIITLYAGGGTNQGNPLPAVGALLAGPQGLAVGPDGSLYIAEFIFDRIHRVGPDGIMRSIAGTGISGGYAGDGGPATQAQLNNPFGVAVGADGTVYISDRDNNRIRWLRPDGIIDTLAGTGTAVTTGDGGLAAQASVQQPFGLALGPDGSIYFGQQGTNFRVRRISPLGDKALATGLIVPSVDGSEVYTFTQGGRHLQTFGALTGALRYEFGYDGAGRLVTITDANGNVTTVERNGQGKPTGILGPLGQRTLLALGVDGFLSQVTNPANEAIDIGYIVNGLLNSFEKPGGQMSTYGYDGVGHLISARDATNKTKTLVRTGTNKDHTVTVTSALGRSSTHRVARLSNGDVQLTRTDSAGIQSTGLLRQNGRHSTTDANGTTLSIDLGPDPRWGMRAPIPTTITVRTPSGLTLSGTTQRTVTLNNPADLFSLNTLTDTLTSNGRTSTSTYVGSTRTLTRTWPTGRQSNVAFDTRGRVVQRQLGNLAPISFTYDAQGRPATVTRGTGGNSRTFIFAYGADGFLQSVTDPLGRIGAVGRDAVGRVTQQTLPGTEVIGITYDDNGNVVAVTPPGQPSHTFAYTARDEVASYTVPAVGTENRQTIATYNDDRQLTRVDRPSGQANTFQFDNAGRVNLIDFATGQQTYAYDSAGRLLSLGNTQSINLAYAYDGVLSTSATSSGAVPGSVTRTYDTNLRVTALQVNGANPIAIQYNLDDVPIQIGNLVVTRNGQTGLITGTTLGAIGDTTSYDGFGMPATYAASHNGSGVYSVTYSRDAVDRITSKSETIGGTTHVFGYTYDLNGGLTEVRRDGALTATYAYDDNGNRLSITGPGGTTTASYDAQDRLVQYGTATYAYSPNGDLVSKTDGGQITTYDYDGTSSLIGVTLPTGTRVDYLLDGQFRRVGRKINGTLVQGFLYQDSLRPIAELDGAGAVVSRFAYMDGGNVPASMIKGGVTYRIITDQLGSPRLVIDVATGQVAQRLDYDEFGTVLTDTNPGFQPFGFAGGLYDSDTKLVRFGARNYDAAAGRWISRDPIGFAGGDPNLYAYVSNDPINNADPEGLVCTDSLQCACLRNPAGCPLHLVRGTVTKGGTQVSIGTSVSAGSRAAVQGTIASEAAGIGTVVSGTVGGTVKIGGAAAVVLLASDSAEAANEVPTESTPPSTPPGPAPTGSTCALDELLARPSNDNPMWNLVNLFFIKYREGTLNPGQIDNLRQRIGQAYGFDPLEWVQ